jgi:hypothetical protein
VTQRRQVKGFLPCLVRWDCHADFCSALAALVGPVQNIIFLAVHYFNAFAPIIQQAGQAAVLGHLSLSVCLWLCCRIPFTRRYEFSLYCRNLPHVEIA